MRLLFLLLALQCVEAAASVVSQPLNYQAEGQVFRGYLAYNEIYRYDTRPGILLLHDSWGLDGTVRRRADMLAAQGYVVLAADLYGQGLTTNKALKADQFARALLGGMRSAEKRFEAALEQLLILEQVDIKRIAALGYGMGGHIALHMARLGSPLNGVVSFHGTLPDGAIPAGRAHQPRILMFVGQDDPFIPPLKIADFKEEMHIAGFPFQLVVYPDTSHGFTHPLADLMAEAFDRPYAYNAAAAQDAWDTTAHFLNQVFWRY